MGQMISEIPSYVINLPERQDRLTAFRAQINHLGIEPKIMPGVKELFARDGIAKAHLNCIRDAKANFYPLCLVMEDDCIFPAGERAKTLLIDALVNTPPDWDVLLGGLYDCDALGPLINGYWRKVEGEFCGTHFYIIRSTAYDRFLSWPGDVHIDRWTNRVLKTYVCDPFFAIQAAGYSDNVGQQADYSHKLKKFRVLGLERAHRR